MKKSFLNFQRGVGDLPLDFNPVSFFGVTVANKWKRILRVGALASDVSYCVRFFGKTFWDILPCISFFFNGIKKTSGCMRKLGLWHQTQSVESDCHLGREWAGAMATRYSWANPCTLPTPQQNSSIWVVLSYLHKSLHSRVRRDEAGMMIIISLEYSPWLLPHNSSLERPHGGSALCCGVLVSVSLWCLSFDSRE